YALAAGTVAPPFAVRYFELNPWDSELAEEQPERVDARGPGVLPATFAAGTRLYTAVEQYVPALACTVRLSARRWALP
ncbi:MAG: hypothetical protein ABIT83_03915, partial [Massilia sp.]